MMIYFELFDISNKTISKILKYLKQYIDFLLNYDKLSLYIDNFKQISEIMFNHGENVNTIDITNTITTNLHKYDQEYFYSAE